MATHIFINPVAGVHLGRVVIEQLAAFRPVMIDPAAIMQQISARVSPGDTVVIGGGDGSASIVIESLFRLGLGEQVTAALLPLGTGNDLARELGNTLPADLVDFIAHRVHAQTATRKVAVWQMGQRYFMNYVGIGLDGQILAMVRRLRKFFPARTVVTKAIFGLAGLRYLGYHIRHDLQVTTDAGVVNLKGKSGIILSNIGYYAGGCRVGISRASTPELSVTILRSGIDLGRIYFSRYRRTQPVLDYTLTKHARIEGAAVAVQMDGEVIPYQSGTISYAGTMTFLITQN
jgi:diacylglycerol kinase family enzyme